MTAPISFGNGISGISRIDSSSVHSDFPKSKSNFKPSGSNVIDYTWLTLEMGNSYDERERAFGTKFSGDHINASPEEHYRNNKNAINSISALAKRSKNSSSAQIMKEALQVLEKAKADSEYLMMCRNVLIAS
ncbi:hypothetical protein [Endozoicomonas sp. ONNA2]|uniref:hypothetical protein n=1 Tax=Endozoicomonas sp. ONNA2 TaxID=2828741 RepID=UPI0021498916|nr:hypothetical protein [Endozoicomonas sp. ONNA2]